MMAHRCSRCGFTYRPAPFQFDLFTCPRCGGTAWPDIEAEGGRGVVAGKAIGSLLSLAAPFVGLALGGILGASIGATIACIMIYFLHIRKDR